MRLIAVLFSLIIITSCNDSAVTEINSEEAKSEVLIGDSLVLSVSGVDSVSLIESETKLSAPVGTQLLPNSANTSFAQEMTTYYLDSVSFTDCASDGEEVYNTKYPIINEVIHNDTILTVDFNFSHECGSEFLCEVELIDNTLNLVYHQYDAYSSCLCCYGLKYYFNIYVDGQYGGETEVKYISINGKDKTKV
ncbi:MAG: hypothetical protein ACI9N1_002539 [Flavobacteriales bacterium]|jgi:hypothetical protein